MAPENFKMPKPKAFKLPPLSALRPGARDALLDWAAARNNQAVIHLMEGRPTRAPPLLRAAKALLDAAGVSADHPR